jgi:hypothetical protein
MTNCQFKRITTESIRCSECGTQRTHEGDPTSYFRRCGADPPRPVVPDREPGERSEAENEWRTRLTVPCTHRGEAVETGTCNVCGMRGQSFQVFACALHDRCAVRRYRNDRPELKVCISCDDFAAPMTDSIA